MQFLGTSVAFLHILARDMHFYPEFETENAQMTERAKLTIS